MLLFFFNDTATTEIYTLSYTTLFRSQRLGGVADEHRARAHRGGGAREPERIGAAAGGSDEAPGAPAELRLQPREIGRVIERQHPGGVRRAAGPDHGARAVMQRQHPERPLARQAPSRPALVGTAGGAAGNHGHL